MKKKTKKYTTSVYAHCFTCDETTNHTVISKDNLEKNKRTLGYCCDECKVIRVFDASDTFKEES